MFFWLKIKMEKERFGLEELNLQVEVECSGCRDLILEGEWVVKRTEGIRVEFYHPVCYDKESGEDY